MSAQESGDVTVIGFRDRGDLKSQNIPAVREELFSLVEQQGRRRIALDLRNIDYLSSEALALFITLHKKLQQVGGRLSLRGVDPLIWEVLEVTRLDRLFEIDDADDEGPEEDLGGVTSRLKPPDPKGGGSVSLQPPSPE